MAAAWPYCGVIQDIVDRLNREINAGLADPRMRARIADLGGTVIAGTRRHPQMAATGESNALVQQLAGRISEGSAWD